MFIMIIEYKQREVCKLIMIIGKLGHAMSNVKKIVQRTLSMERPFSLLWLRSITSWVIKIYL